MKNLETEILVEIGKKLKELRIRKGYSSYETFAFDHKLPRAHYWKIESGKTNLTLRTLIEVLNIHDIEFHDFIHEVYSK